MEALSELLASRYSKNVNSDMIFCRKEGVAIKITRFLSKVLITMAASIFLWLTPQITQADSPISTINETGNYFANNDDHSNNDPAVEQATPQHPLAMPKKTPTPVEGYRWSKRRIYIYMDGDDPQVKLAFKDAVKAWNRSKIIHFVWTKHASHANVFAKSGDLSADSVDNSIGASNHHDLGATQSSYDPDKHALLTATSILDPNALRFSSRSFRSKVAQHELGHALGLAHAPEYEDSVMIPRNVRSGITKLDLKTLKALYEP